MKKLLKIVLLLLFTFSCANVSFNEEYVLQKITIENKTEDVLDKNLIISFDGVKLNGTSSINVYSATYKLIGENIKIDDIYTTKMAGTFGDEILEKKYLKVLKSANKIMKNEDKSIVVYNNKTKDSLVYIKKVTENDLDKNKYKLISNSKISIAFDGNNLYGVSTVNTYFATYKIVNNKIKIENLTATLKAGSEKEMKKEMEFFAKLSKEYVINIYKDLLILTNGKEKLVFVRLIKG